MNRITTLNEFLDFARSANRNDIYEVFENETSAELRREVYDYSDLFSVEPFRSACSALGWTYNIQSLKDY